MDHPSGSWADLPVRSLGIGRRDLTLRHTLNCGQAFRWREEPDGWWHGVVRGRAIRLRESDDDCLAQVFPADGAEALLRDYLRLDVDLPALADELGARDETIRTPLTVFAGLRVVDQEPTETLLSYMCSPANSVDRISRATRALARQHGRLIARLDGEPYHAFPMPEALAATPDEDYQAAGLGWRGAGVRRIATLLGERPVGWLDSLRGLPFDDARAELMAFPGVGPKIADCVCLFALRKDEAVPVDTHVWALARELFPNAFASGRVSRTLTPLAYERVRALYVARYGEFAGWAQEYLYHWRRQGYPSNSG
jgi:N-glycosylase/DNA lyase